MKLHWFLFIFFFFMFFGSCNSVYAQEQFDIVTTIEMKQFLDQKKKGAVDFILVNSLDAIVHRHSSIDGSVNIPWYKVDELQERLGKIKNMPIIIYCEGPGGVSAYKAAVSVKKLGYENIKLFKGGLESWAKEGHEIISIEPLPEYEVKFTTAELLLKDLNNAESKKCMDWKGNPLMTILDLRPENFLEKKFPVFNIKTRCKTIKLLADQLSEKHHRGKIPRTGRVVTVTETGKRDSAVIRYLYKHGFKNIVGLQSGIQSWIQLDFAINFGNKL